MSEKMTGYPSIDKPWLKYYEENVVNAEIPCLTMYDYLVNGCKKNIQQTAIRFFGKEINYETFLENIDRTAIAFSDIGVCEGDIVSIISLSSPETVASIYALNRIGAVACMEYVTQTPESLLRALTLTGSKVVLILDVFLAQYKEVLLSSSVEKIIVLAANDSFPFATKILYQIKQPRISLESNFVWYRDFLKNAKGDLPSINLNPYNPALLVSTSGSTGVPKKVVLSSHSINSVAWQYGQGSKRTGEIFKANEKMLCMSVPFLAIGFVLGIHMPLCQAMRTVLILSPEPNQIAKLFLKELPNHFLGTPPHTNAIIAKSKKRTDLSHLYVLACGGESPSEEKQTEIENFLREHNSKSHHIIGYGMTEVSGGAITNNNVEYKLGSVGIPLSKTNIKVVDTDTGKELTYGQIGELMISSPGIMLGYFKNESETKGSLVKENGDLWIKTGDLAMIDEEGFVFIKGRIKRIYLRSVPEINQVLKMFPDHIETETLKIPNVKECAVVAAKHEEFVTVPVAFIVLENDTEYEREQITLSIAERLPKYELPVAYHFVEELPKTQSGKKDYKLLEDIAKDKGEGC